MLALEETRRTHYIEAGSDTDMIEPNSLHTILRTILDVAPVRDANTDPSSVAVYIIVYTATDDGSTAFTLCTKIVVNCIQSAPHRKHHSVSVKKPRHSTDAPPNPLYRCSTLQIRQRCQPLDHLRPENILTISATTTTPHHQQLELRTTTRNKGNDIAEHPRGR